MRGERGQAEGALAERCLGGAFEGVIKAHQNLAEHRVAGRIANGPMKSEVGLAVVHSRRDDSQQPVTQPVDFGALLGAGVLRGQPNRAGFDHAAHFQQAQQPFALQPDHGGQRPVRGLDPGGQIGAIAAPAPDDPQPLPPVQRLADRRSADPQRIGQRHLWRQAVADLQPAAFDHFGQRIQHGHAACRGVERFQKTQG